MSSLFAVANNVFPVGNKGFDFCYGSRAIRSPIIISTSTCTYNLAYEPPEGRKERPTLHYSVERHLILNAINTSLIWTYPQVVMSGVESVANAHRVYVLKYAAATACASQSAPLRLDVFTGRCGVVACRFRSLSISLSCSIP